MATTITFVEVESWYMMQIILQNEMSHAVTTSSPRPQNDIHIIMWAINSDTNQKEVSIN